MSIWRRRKADLAEIAELATELTQERTLHEVTMGERDEARSWARHGYEIGQRSCTWSDHNVAPAWLTEGWPTSFPSDLVDPDTTGETERA